MSFVKMEHAKNRHESNEYSILKKLVNYVMNLLTNQSMLCDQNLYVFFN
jgi:hypothetical protein